MNKADVIKAYSLEKVVGIYSELLEERKPWEREWKRVDKYVMSGRGIFQLYKQPRRRLLTTGGVIVNDIARQASHVLTSGIYSGMTNPSSMWFKREWADERINEVFPLKQWLQDSTKLLHTGLHRSGFYAMANSLISATCNFGTGVFYVGEDTATDVAPFRFELLSAGEYAYSLDAIGRIGTFVRTVYKSERQMVETWPDTVSDKMVERVAKNKAGVDVRDRVILELVMRKPFMNKAVTRIVYELEGVANDLYSNEQADISKEPLEISGFHEFPYFAFKWDEEYGDAYGSKNPGFCVVEASQRLQEVEKSTLMAVHKEVDPALMIPSRFRGKFKSMPGGRNYSSYPGEKIEPVHQSKFNFNGVFMTKEAIEKQIQKIYFNDIFLTGARDPNASPMKAEQVKVQEQEKMFRIGPMVERLSGTLVEMLTRCSNIMERKGLFPELSPELKQMAGDSKIAIISPLASAQRSLELVGLNSYLGFIMQGAQFDQAIMDKVDIDNAADLYADVTGVDMSIVPTPEQVAQKRQARQKRQQAEDQAKQKAAVADMQTNIDQGQASAMKTQAETNAINAEAQQTMQEIGMI